MCNEEIVYSLNVKDIQTVAEAEIGRKLNQKEIETLKELIAERIDWYEAISDSIYNYLPIEK